MALPWYRVHIVVLNDPGRLIAVHIMHTAHALLVIMMSTPGIQQVFNYSWISLPLYTKSLSLN